MWGKLSDKIESILRRKNDPPNVGLEARSGNTDLRPIRVERGAAPSDVKVAQNQLRIMKVEREILSHAIRHLYEAEADGKINKGELKSLLSGYKERMIQVKNTIQHDQSVAALYNLECIQDDLMAIFNKHFDDLNKKTEELKARLGIEPASKILPKKKKEKKRKRRRVLQQLKRAKLTRGSRKYEQK